MIMKCDREEGLQVHLNSAEGLLKYRIKLPDDDIDSTKSTVRYTMQAFVVTVHSKTTPVRLDITNDNNTRSTGGETYLIQIPYTHGGWEWTKPIEVELTRGPSTNFLTFLKKFGLSLLLL